MQARIVLEDGTVLQGQSFGAETDVLGEIVFNTSMMGYQEILTDPSYRYQIVNMTYPLIGNYGINDEDFESDKIQVAGFIVREYSKIYSNRRAKKSLSEFLKEHNIPGIEGIDTRYVTRLTRTKGSMMGLISFDNSASDEKLIKKVQNAPKMTGLDLVKDVTTKKTYSFTDKKVKAKYKVFAYDFGIKTNILRLLSESGCEITVVPADYPADNIIKQNPDGVFLSNGPGDPEPLSYAIKNIKKIIDAKIPTFGICLGHQLLGLALGGKTYKLKFGHRGANQPVKADKNARVEISSQNHGFSVDMKSLPEELVEFTYINLNDNTVEGMRCKKSPAFSVQHHPEANPGPHDSRHMFNDFVKLMEENKR